MKLILPCMVLLLLAGCGAPKDRVMASCQTRKASDALKASGAVTAAEQFQACMGSEDYHLSNARPCRDGAPVTEPNAYALREPECWAWSSSNWP